MRFQDAFTGFKGAARHLPTAVIRRDKVKPNAGMPGYHTMLYTASHLKGLHMAETSPTYQLPPKTRALLAS